MAKQIFKSILLGILIGVLFFMMPFFILKFFLIFLLIGAICRLWWGGGRRRWGHHHGWHYAYADKIRNMSEEEYTAFKSKTQDWNCGYNHRCGGYYNYGCDEAPNKNPSGKTQDDKKETNQTNDQQQ
jgi:hypothetical protein